MEVMRSLFLGMAKNEWAREVATKYGLRFGASRFVAGESLEEALTQIQRLNKLGIMATLDRLGEFVNTEEEAVRATGWALETLEGIAAQGVESHLSLKLTQFGLDLGEEFCEQNLRQILTKAQQLGIFVRMDMEDFPRCQKSIELYRKLHAEFPDTGLAIQAYLYRAQQDVLELQTNLRLVKGAYREPATVAFPHKPDVDANFRELIKLQLDNDWYAAVATHDENIIEWTKAYAANQGIPRARYEFQMLYGIANDLQKRLANEGYQVRVYVPYGRDWYGYFMRRLAERPANVWFVLKNWFRS